MIYDVIKAFASFKVGDTYELANKARAEQLIKAGIIKKPDAKQIKKETK